MTDGCHAEAAPIAAHDRSFAPLADASVLLFCPQHTPGGDGSAVRPASAGPGGPLVVVTSAGFLSRDADMLPRIRLFVEGVTEVKAWYGALTSNLRNGAFNGPDGRGGFTCWLWRSDDAMREAAYHHGRHRARMEEIRASLRANKSETFDCLDVSFQQVVHSGRIGETGVTTQQISRSAPNEHPPECLSHARSSRGDGTFGHRRPPFQSPGGAGIRGVGQDRSPLDRPFQSRGAGGHAGPLLPAKGDPDPDRRGAGGADHHAPPPAPLRAAYSATDRGFARHRQPGAAPRRAVAAARPGPRRADCAL